MNDNAGTWDGNRGTAGGPRFGSAVAALVRERELDDDEFAAQTALDRNRVTAIFAGDERLTIAELARVARALRLHAIEFLQRSNILSLEAYAAGLDPLYFLPAGPTRFDARIYMREINPRHAVPERDMLRRNPVFKELAADELLDATGRLELELTYLLRAATQVTGGTL